MAEEIMNQGQQADTEALKLKTVVLPLYLEPRK